MRKQIIFIACVIVVILIAYFAGAWSGQKSGRAESDKQYQDRLAIITKLYNGIQIQNVEIRGINQDLENRNTRNAKRLEQAEDIIRGMQLQSTSDGDTIQRIIDNAEKLRIEIQSFTDNQ